MSIHVLVDVGDGAEALADRLCELDYGRVTAACLSFDQEGGVVEFSTADHDAVDVMDTMAALVLLRRALEEDAE